MSAISQYVFFAKSKIPEMNGFEWIYIQVGERSGKNMEEQPQSLQFAAVYLDICPVLDVET